MLKEKRGLSGIYFRYKNKETGKWENRVFEDMNTDEQKELLKDKNKEYVESLAIQLANSLNEISDKFNLTKE